MIISSENNYRFIFIFYLIIFSLFFLTGNIEGQQTGTLQENIWLQLAQTTSINRQKLHSRKYLKDFYRKRNFQPVWITYNSLLPKANKFIKIIKNSSQKGLLPEDYHLSLINKKIEKYKTDKNIETLVQLELILSDSFLIYISDLDQGRFDYTNMERKWFQTNSSNNYSKILKEITTYNMSDKINEFEPEIFQYIQLKKLLHKYQEIEQNESWPKIKINEKLSKGDKNKNLYQIRKRLKKDPGLEVTLTSEKKDIFDDNLKKAILNFQKNYGLKTTGNIDKATLKKLKIPVEMLISIIKLNLDRLRWSDIDPAAEYIMVNLPEYKLKIIKNEQTILKMKTVIGRSEQQTPVFSEEIYRLIINPVWRIPRSIIINNYLPQIKENKSWINNHYIQIYDRENDKYTKVNPEKINWNQLNQNNFDYHFWQKPGPWNSLGNIIFRNASKNNIYLHDSPSRHLFNKRKRPYSFGCVRVEKALELAYYILNTSEGWNKSKVDRLVKNRTETAVNLNHPIPLHLIYLTTWVAEDDQQLNLRDDIYRRDEKLLKYFNHDFTWGRE
ncbi:MAG: L,D-transpeptidase family protein [Bacillota bacterium]